MNPAKQGGSTEKVYLGAFKITIAAKSIRRAPLRGRGQATSVSRRTPSPISLFSQQYAW